ncbi:PDZ domain-containing protein [Nocardioides taihuensis]|uniref:PDZ domain-containing protein n=1 Tax=Nocardioides taihuensis TaxID=1835606 RepID=A0ABW0BN28_9ACTN
MTQRIWAGLIALPLLVALWVAAILTPLPYVTYAPGLTVDVLGAPDGHETIQVSGHKTYRTDGELRMTTVFVTQPDAKLNLFNVMGRWFQSDDAVYPYGAVYQEGESDAQNKVEGQIQMVSSQDAAIAVALTELGIDFDPAVRVFGVDEGTPAEGELEVGDLILAVDGKPVATTDDVRQAVEDAGAGQPVTLRVLSKGKEGTVRITPDEVDGAPRLGVRLLPAYHFPFDVSVDIDPAIGGPSAGLMFSLGIYDTLTPGSLTGGHVVAGTGTMDASGKVGPIGGIQQKIAGARDAGAELFLVPPDNCAEALGADNGDMRLVRADTMHDAVQAVEAWVDDPDAELPTCSASANAGAAS